MTTGEKESACQADLIRGAENSSFVPGRAGLFCKRIREEIGRYKKIAMIFQDEHAAM